VLNAGESGGPGPRNDDKETRPHAIPLMIRIDEKTAKAPTERLMADMGRLMEEMTQAGVLIDTAGLRPTSEGVRV
jgi:hypothetical protein